MAWLLVKSCKSKNTGVAAERGASCEVMLAFDGMSLRDVMQKQTESQGRAGNSGPCCGIIIFYDDIWSENVRKKSCFFVKLFGHVGDMIGYHDW